MLLDKKSFYPKSSTVFGLKWENKKERVKELGLSILCSAAKNSDANKKAHKAICDHCFISDVVSPQCDHCLKGNVSLQKFVIKNLP